MPSDTAAPSDSASASKNGDEGDPLFVAWLFHFQFNGSLRAATLTVREQQQIEFGNDQRREVWQREGGNTYQHDVSLSWRYFGIRNASSSHTVHSAIASRSRPAPA